MMIIGCDFHPSWQQIAWLDSETGETGERKLVHASGDATRFYHVVDWNLGARIDGKTCELNRRNGRDALP